MNQNNSIISLLSFISLNNLYHFLYFITSKNCLFFPGIWSTSDYIDKRFSSTCRIPTTSSATNEWAASGWTSTSIFHVIHSFSSVSTSSICRSTNTHSNGFYERCYKSWRRIHPSSNGSIFSNGNICYHTTIIIKSATSFNSAIYSRSILSDKSTCSSFFIFGSTHECSQCRYCYFISFKIY